MSHDPNKHALSLQPTATERKGPEGVVNRRAYPPLNLIQCESPSHDRLPVAGEPMMYRRLSSRMTPGTITMRRATTTNTSINCRVVIRVRRMACSSVRPALPVRGRFATRRALNIHVDGSDDPTASCRPVLPVADACQKRCDRHEPQY